jgi:hypothetical protein
MKTRLEYKHWTAKEDEILIKSDPSYTREKMTRLLPGRSPNAIKLRSHHLGLPKRLFDWVETEDQIRRTEFRKCPKNQLLAMLPNRTWYAIMSRGHRGLGLDRCRQMTWSAEELSAIRTYYPSGGTDKVLSLLPHRTPSGFKRSAGLMGVKMVLHNCNVEPLLKLDVLSCYWLGLLFADGHFVPSKGFLEISLHKRDAETVYAFAKFIHTTNLSVRQHDQVGVSVSSKEQIRGLCEKFSIQSNKTENPPNISCIKDNDDLMIALLIGLIDGDGNIYNANGCKATYARIECHISWMNFYTIFREFLIKKFKNMGRIQTCSIGISNKGYAQFLISSHFVMKELKKAAIRMGLPVMRRKWDKINLDHSTYQEEAPRIEAEIKSLLLSGASKEQVYQHFNISKFRVKRCLQKLQNSDPFFAYLGRVKYRSFEEARTFARSLDLRGYKEWKAYGKSGKLPRDIPRNPYWVYKENGWVSWENWLGTDGHYDKRNNHPKNNLDTYPH